MPLSNPGECRHHQGQSLKRSHNFGSCHIYVSLTGEPLIGGGMCRVCGRQCLLSHNSVLWGVLLEAPADRHLAPHQRWPLSIHGVFCSGTLWVGTFR